MEDNGQSSKWHGSYTFSNLDEEEDTYEFTDDNSGGAHFWEDGLGTNFSTGSNNDGSEDTDGDYFGQIKKVDSMEDILSMDLKGLSPYLLVKVDFVTLDTAFEFYNWYGRHNGFSVRKGKILYNSKGQILQREFVCHRQGFKEDRGLTNEMRKRQPKPETRCGCEAKFRVHIDGVTERWYITCFTDKHNHQLLDERYYGMLPAHRRMSESDIMQMNNMLNVGIDPPYIYGSFGSQYGGFEKIGFRRKDIYNQIGKQRRKQQSDAKAALKYLQALASDDPMMFYRHSVDDNGRLQHLFFCDGLSRIDFDIYGDVLAFNATYGKKKYHCPLVVFSGVNNHKKSIIFGAAIVASETEETYIWVLEQFLEAMSGKSPISVITDGDVAMRNAIKRVFPNAYHRLCAWHLIRNVTSNVSIPAFVSKFEKCMFREYEVGKFRCKWFEMIDEFGLHENRWVQDIYEKRKMWATAHIRGTFFAGFRTTSRCEGLHSQLGKYIRQRYNLSDFLFHFHRALNFMRYKEVEDDFASDYGDIVLQTNFKSLERSTMKLFTKEIFMKFRDVLQQSTAMVVTGCKETCTYFIYIVSKYQVCGLEWHVSFYPSGDIFKCSCKRMESHGLPCDHIVAVLVYLNFGELAECLVLRRWTKKAKVGNSGKYSQHSKYWDSHKAARYKSLLFRYMRLSALASENDDDFVEHMEKSAADINKIEHKRSLQDAEDNSRDVCVDETLRDPAMCKTKGRGKGGVSSATARKASKRAFHCSACGEPGHNKKTCVTRTCMHEAVNTQSSHINQYEADR